MAACLEAALQWIVHPIAAEKVYTWHRPLTGNRDPLPPNLHPSIQLHISTWSISDFSVSVATTCTFVCVCPRVCGHKQLRHRPMEEMLLLWPFGPSDEESRPGLGAEHSPGIQEVLGLGLSRFGWEGLPPKPLENGFQSGLPMLC